MSEHWSRRAFLATLGVTTLAGCQTDTGGDGAATPGDASTATPETPDTDGTQTHGGSDDSERTPPEAEPETPDSIDGAWSQPAHDAGRSNYAPGSAGPTSRVASLWGVTTDGSLSAPVVAREAVYVGGEDGLVRAFDAATGTEDWHRSVGDAAGTPRVLDGRVYVPGEGAIHALNEDGSDAWSVETAPLHDVVVTGSGVFYLADDTDGDDDDRGVVVALDTAGEQRWRTTVEDPWEERIFAGAGRVFVPSGPYDFQLWAFDGATGEFLPDRKPARGADFPETRFYREGTHYMVEGFFGSIDARPVTDDGVNWSAGLEAGGTFGIAGGGDRVYVAQNTHDSEGVRLFALSRESGSTVWEQSLEGFPGRPVVTSEGVYTRTDARFRCFDPADGTERFSQPSESVGEQFVVVDDLVVTIQDSVVRALRPE